MVLRACRRARERRYESAQAFADDIARFQLGQAVEARGDGAAYRMGKSLRRNRMRIAALVLIGISVIGGGAASWRALQYRSQLETLRGELVVVKSHEQQYRSLPP